MRRIALASFLVCFSWLFAGQLMAQDETYKGALIYQFTRYIEWENLGDQFQIEIVGSSKLTPVLKEIASKKKVSEKPINVKEVALSSMGAPQILVVPSAQSGQLQEIVSKIGNKPILIITEKPGLASEGAGINFVKANGKIQFELNKTKLVKSNIKPSLSLERLATKVL